MNTYADHSQENQSGQGAGTPNRPVKSPQPSMAHGTDHQEGHQASAQDAKTQTLQAQHNAMNAAPRVQQLKAMHKAMNSRPRVQQLKAMQQAMNHPQPPTPTLQKKDGAPGAAPATGGLPNTLKAGVEYHSGQAMDDVTVHYNSPKPGQMRAHAYAQGTDIHLGPGQEKHLGHEAWHVAQQKQGRVKPTTQLSGGGGPAKGSPAVAINDDASLEKEADTMGAKAWQSGQGAKADTVHQQQTQAGSHGPIQRVVRLRSEGLAEVGFDTVKAWLAQGSFQPNSLQACVLRDWIADGEHHDYNWAYGQAALMEDIASKVAVVVGTLDNDYSPYGQMAAEAACAHDPTLNIKGLTKLGKRIGALYNRVSSVLRIGVLPPTELAEQGIGHTPSSDAFNAHKISALDIDTERNQDSRYLERFPYPGHQSINPVLERRNDIFKIANATLRAAAKNNAEAVANVTALQREENNTDALETFMAQAKGDQRMMARLGQIARFSEPGRRQLQQRAEDSAMVVSTGDALTNSSPAKEKWLKKDGYGPKVDELRAPTRIEPEAITHVLMPAFMEHFAPARNLHANVRFVDTTNTRVGYYDETSRVQGELDLDVPNYQGALDDLMQTHTKMVTHITNV